MDVSRAAGQLAREKERGRQSHRDRKVPAPVRSNGSHNRFSIEAIEELHGSSSV